MVTELYNQGALSATGWGDAEPQGRSHTASPLLPNKQQHFLYMSCPDGQESGPGA